MFKTGETLQMASMKWCLPKVNGEFKKRVNSSRSLQQTLWIDILCGVIAVKLGCVGISCNCSCQDCSILKTQVSVVTSGDIWSLRETVIGDNLRLICRSKTTASTEKSNCASFRPYTPIANTITLSFYRFSKIEYLMISFFVVAPCSCWKTLLIKKIICLIRYPMRMGAIMN